MKLLLIGLMTCLTAACASQPVVQQGTAQAIKTNGEITKEKILAMQRQGYKIINKDGEVYFCRKEIKTGTHLPGDTVCMTEKEVDDLRSRTQDALGNIMRTVPPPQGK
jgi:hypothetical protein